MPYSIEDHKIKFETALKAHKENLSKTATEKFELLCPLIFQNFEIDIKNHLHSCKNNSFYCQRRIEINLKNQVDPYKEYSEHLIKMLENYFSEFKFELRFGNQGKDCLLDITIPENKK